MVWSIAKELLSYARYIGTFEETDEFLACVLDAWLPCEAPSF